MKDFVLNIKYILRKIDDGKNSFKKKIIIIYFLILISVILSYVFPKCFQYIIDHIIPQRNIYLLLQIVCILSLLYLIKFTVDLVIDKKLLWFKEKFSEKLRITVLEHYSKLTYEEFENIYESEKYSYLVTDVENLKKIFDKSIIYITKEVITLIIGFFICYSIYASMTIIIYSFLLLTAIPIYKLGRLFRKKEEMTYKEFSILLNNMFEPILKFFQVKSHNIFPLLLRKYIYKNSVYHKNYLWLQIRKIAMNSSQITLNQVILLLAFSYSSFTIISGSSSTGQLFAYNIILAILLSSFSSLVTINLDLQIIIVSSRRIVKFLRKETELYFLNTADLKREFEILKFENVFFKYPLAQNEFCLKNITFSLKQSEKIAIIGRNGSGKSTIIKLILGMYSNYSGSVFLNGLDLKSTCKTYLRSIIGFIPQENFFIEGSLKDNIILDNKEDQRWLDEVLNICCLSNYINNLNESFDTFITAEKNFLSGGFQQRVAYARALYKKPKLILIDEGTSQLDPQADKYFVDMISNLPNKEISVISITHRLKTIEVLDRALLMDEGEIIDSILSRDSQRAISFFEKVDLIPL